MHANARLTLHGRRLLVARVRDPCDHSGPQSHVARELRVSRQCVSRWVTRYDREGDLGLRDRSSRPHHSPTRHSADTEKVILAARREQRCGPAAIAATTASRGTLGIADPGPPRRGPAGGL